MRPSGEIIPSIASTDPFWIGWRVHSCVTLGIGILEGDLTVCAKLRGEFRRSHELTLAVGSGDAVSSPMVKPSSHGEATEPTRVFTICEI